MRKLLCTGLLLVVSLAVGGPMRSALRAQAAPSDTRSNQARLVGTWRFVKFFNTDPSGIISHPFGENPDGYIVWDNTGRVFVQVARGPALKAFASGDDLAGTDSEVRSAFERYDAYFGTYEVDEKNSVVIHHVANNLRPGYTGIDQRRPFRFQGDSILIIENVLSNGRGRGYRELVRVK